MTQLGLIVGIGALIYGCRLVGFLVGEMRLTPYWERFFRLMPIAVFATLVTAGLVRVPTLQAGHVLALVSAGIVAWRSRQIGLSVVVGLGMLWVLSVLGAA